MAQSLPALPRGTTRKEEVIDHLALPHEVIQALRAKTLWGGRSLLRWLWEFRRGIGPVGVEEKRPLARAPLDLALKGCPLGRAGLRRPLRKREKRAGRGKIRRAFRSAHGDRLKGARRGGVPEDLRRGPALPDHVPLTVKGRERAVLLHPEDDVAVVDASLTSGAQGGEPFRHAPSPIGMGVEVMDRQVLRAPADEASAVGREDGLPFFGRDRSSAVLRRHLPALAEADGRADAGSFDVGDLDRPNARAHHLLDRRGIHHMAALRRLHPRGPILPPVEDHEEGSPPVGLPPGHLPLGGTEGGEHRHDLHFLPFLFKVPLGEGEVRPKFTRLS